VVNEFSVAYGMLYIVESRDYYNRLIRNGVEARYLKLFYTGNLDC
jgi:hypothetical protein